MTSGLKILALAGIIVLAGIIIHFINSARLAKKLKQELAYRWGKIPEDKYTESDLLSISSYFKNLLNVNPNLFFIDDITWNDLDMDRVFKRLNCTQSTIGEEYLYAMLRRPSFSESELEKRKTLITFFSDQQAPRTAIQLVLARLGKLRSIDITNILFNSNRVSGSCSYFYRILSVVAVLTVFLIFVNPAVGIPLFILSFATNLTVYYRAKNVLSTQLEVLAYIVSMVNCAKNIVDLDIKQISNINSTLDECYKKVKSINKKSFSLFYMSSDPLVEYTKIALLTELIEYETISAIIRKYHKELLEIYNCLGLLDALISIASYRASLPFFCIPGLYLAKPGYPLKIKFNNIYHPLLKNPVANSFETEKPVLITGSNASGKSTFLKTAAINAIFAQAICTCLAESYSSPYFRVYTSMALKDSIVNNESYFMAEIKSLKRIIDNLDGTYPCLCFIDEVLRGTNTVERIAASSQVLHYLSLRNCLCITATHDIELTSILSRFFDNYHFQETFKNNEITFDYKIYPGKSSTRNAIKLLKYMGYDDSIVKQAELRAEEFISSGRWHIIEDAQVQQ